MDLHQDIGSSLSFITVTHYSPRESYDHLAPPSDGIVRETINSFRDGIPGLDSCPHYIVYNKPKKPTKDSKKYRGNLKNLCEETYNLKLLIKENTGLGPAIIYGLQHINTPLVCFVEHDWELISDVDINGILQTFSQYPHVNSIRFNKRVNNTSLWDTIIEEENSMPISLCRVSSVGNHPQIIRSEIFEKWVKCSEPDLPTILRGFLLHYSSPQSAINYSKAMYDKYVNKEDIVRKFDNVEFILDTAYKSDIKKNGFELAHTNWGVYLYGSKGSGPFVEHLGR